MIIRRIHRALFLLAVLLANAGVLYSQQSLPSQANESAAQRAISYLFVSPNTSENLTLPEALRKLNSPEESALIAAGRVVACRLGLRARIVKSIGSWTDGVEHSTILRLRADEATTRYANAWLGKRARQKSVLYFQQRAGGTARMYILFPHGGQKNPARLAGFLQRSGIEYRTLVPGARRTLIYVVDLGGELQRKIADAARALRASYRALSGTADFIGDGNDRDKAQQVFNEVITKYEQEHPLLRSNCGGEPSQSLSPSRNGAPRLAAAARRLPTGTVVTVEGVVTVPSGTFKSSISDEGFAFQDRSGGFYVRMQTNLGLRLGQRVRVTGKLDENNELLALVPAGADAIKVLDRAAQVKPESMATGKINETTEGRLVKVTGKITRAVVADLPYGYRLFLDDGSGEIQVYVSASAQIDLSHLQPGQRVSATGLSGQYKDHYEVEPRFPADIELLP